MKKIFLLFSMILCCLLAQATPTLTTTATTVNSGASITVTGNGEDNTEYFIAYTGTSVYSVSPAGYLTNAGYQYTGVQYYNKVTGAATSLQFTLTSTARVAITVTYKITMTPYDNVNFHTLPPIDSYITVTINPPPFYGNDQQSGYWNKQGCGDGYSGTAVQYIINANTYFEVTKAAANTDALNALNAGGQTYANNHGQCVVSTIFPVYNRSASNLSITFQTTDGTQLNFGAVVNAGTTGTFNINPYTYNIIISPAGSPVNVTMQLSTGEQYGPSPGHTFTNVTIGAGHTVNLTAY